ncbi:hypothetical protein PF005_g379 [Phytophthora fragariae]|uniref:Uncharacterized protein n=1 Tax=Phytophthora fragariae TaxID=53985 RepID=A0A6A4E3C9_9STRA|nr:hypothetical protein PF003_g9788 [Phytophthora fragariae]KAE8950093.1 hypothetical protein PF009_g378 [Phytophthora fragariae]KAE9139439.1 hypothetical protein PF007_g1020 [Phytophthora fragariae]KAE9155804.1 hypothetical protein PF006_g256 [Phytophthora fragariae]KAE9238084.1 hypothetical protein PF005_g379 [Phytophthora fragariae]
MAYHPYKPDASGYTALHRFAKRRDDAVVTLLPAMFVGSLTVGNRYVSNSAFTICGPTSLVIK